MQAIILCAGQGSRLGLNIPKCMIPIKEKGKDISFLQHQLNFLSKIPKLEEIVLVTGYKNDIIDKSVTDLDTNGKALIVVNNKEFNQHGIVESMLCAMNFIDQPEVLRISGDIYFRETAILDLLLNSDETSFAINKIPSYRNIAAQAVLSSTNRLEEVQVGQVGKDNVSGYEWTDIELYRDYDLQKIMDHAPSFRSKAFYYCDLVNYYLLNTNRTFKTEIVKDVYEIDTKEDLKGLEELLALEVSKTFWKNLEEYPRFPYYKERLNCDLKYLKKHIDKNKVVLDYGCGEGNHILSLQAVKKHAQDIRTPLFRKSFSKLTKANIKCSFIEDNKIDYSSFDFVYSLGVLHYIILDKNLEQLFLKLNSQYFLFRVPCSISQSYSINTWSEELNKEYAVKYRTIQDLSSLLEKYFITKEVKRAFPDEIESKYGTKQYYFLCKRK